MWYVALVVRFTRGHRPAYNEYLVQASDQQAAEDQAVAKARRSYANVVTVTVLSVQEDKE